MDQSSEVLELVNKRDEVIGCTTRKDAHAKLLRHRAVHAFLFNDKGQLFVQQRSASKDTNPLKRGSSMGGHVDVGETYEQAAVRELREELGIHIRERELLPLKKFEPASYNWMEFAFVYLVRYEENRHGKTHLSEEECESGKFWELEDIRQSVSKHPGEWTPDFVQYFQWMLANKKHIS